MQWKQFEVNSNVRKCSWQERQFTLEEKETRVIFPHINFYLFWYLVRFRHWTDSTIHSLPQQPDNHDVGTSNANGEQETRTLSSRIAFEPGDCTPEMPHSSDSDQPPPNRSTR